MMSQLSKIKTSIINTSWISSMSMPSVSSISRDFANMGFLFTRPPWSNLHGGPVTQNTTNNTDSFLYTYANWLSLSMKDWKLALNNKLLTLRLQAQPYFHSFKATDLMQWIEQDPDPHYRSKFQQMLQVRLPNWQTAFKKFTSTVNWNIHEPSGMTFWLAFPLLATFKNLPYEFAELVSKIMMGVQALHNDPKKVLHLKFPFELPFTLHITTDDSGSLYLFSSGPSVNSSSPWLSFQLAFALYNAYPIPKKGVHSTTLSKLNCLIWMWGDTMFYSLLDLPPTFQANSFGKMKDFNKDNTDLHESYYYLHYLAEVYSKNSVVLNNLYEWLQCVISAMSEHQQPKIYGYKPELVQTYDDLIPKVSLVAAFTDKMITPETLEILTKSVYQLT